jgi:hypothetical protein
VTLIATSLAVAIGILEPTFTSDGVVQRAM